MAPRLLELSVTSTMPITVNANHIAYYHRGPNSSRTEIVFSSGNSVLIQEDPEVITQMIDHLGLKSPYRVNVSLESESPIDLPLSVLPTT